MQDYLAAVNQEAGASGKGDAAGHAHFVQSDVVIEDAASIFTCGECAMKFASAELLEEHALRHSGERPFKCRVCGRGFGAKFALRSHLLSHDGEYTARLKRQLSSANGCSKRQAVDADADADADAELAGSGRGKLDVVDRG